MLFKSQVFTQASGSVGGLTYSRNAGGMYTRARAIPVNPASLQQQEVRNAIGVLTARWVETLTQAQRDDWAVYAGNVTLINRLGEALPVAPLAQYVRSNVPRIQAGLPIVDDAPTVFDLGSFSMPGPLTATAPTGLSLPFTNADDWANEDDAAMLIYVSRPQNPSVNFFKGPYRLAGSILGDGTTPPASPAVLVAPFPLNAGQKVFLQGRVTRADGRLSTPFQLDDIAA